MPVSRCSRFGTSVPSTFDLGVQVVFHLSQWPEEEEACRRSTAKSKMDREGLLQFILLSVLKRPCDDKAWPELDQCYQNCYLILIALSADGGWLRDLRRSHNNGIALNRRVRELRKKIED